MLDTARKLALHGWGTGLSLTGCRCHVQGRLYVRVAAAVTRPEERTSAITNTFLFLFEVQMASTGDSSGCRVLKRVLPSTEEEALMMRRVSEH